MNPLELAILATLALKEPRCLTQEEIHSELGCRPFLTDVFITLIELERAGLVRDEFSSFSLTSLGRRFVSLAMTMDSVFPISQADGDPVRDPGDVSDHILRDEDRFHGMTVLNLESLVRSAEQRARQEGK